MKIAKISNPFKKPAIFLTWFNNKAIKVELKKGETKRFYKFEYHDEGWRSDSQEFTRNGHVINRIIFTDGTDCDGRLSFYNTDQCVIAELHAFVPDVSHGEKPSRDRFPLWVKKEYSQRDYAAEAAGY
jgi:hypothetical protein